VAQPVIRAPYTVYRLEGTVHPVDEKAIDDPAK
jgi:hypothetical protein